MNFITFVLCLYVIVLGLYLFQVWWDRRRAEKFVLPPPPIMGLKEGETIIAVSDEPGALQFYIGTDAVDEKSYE